MSINYLKFHSSIPITSSSSEMDLRNGISRNYYAVLHYLKGYIDRKQIPDDVYATGTHQRVIDALSNHLSTKKKAKVRKQLIIIFTNAKNSRIKADYLLNEDIKFWEAEQVAVALEKVKTLLEPELASHTNN